jgi:hypothetical protein
MQERPVKLCCQFIDNPVRVLPCALSNSMPAKNYFTFHSNWKHAVFTGLNRIKPEMIQEATTKAREVALKFAQDSKSKLGKIKQASQGQFEINPRDKNNPHIKKVRIVSTVEYYLSD